MPQDPKPSPTPRPKQTAEQLEMAKKRATQIADYEWRQLQKQEQDARDIKERDAMLPPVPVDESWKNPTLEQIGPGKEPSMPKAGLKRKQLPIRKNK